MTLEMLQQLQTTLLERDLPVLQEIAAEMDRLWLHPDEFEQAPDDWDDIYAESYIGDEDTHLVFHLGIVFGIEYERRYPTGAAEEWPTPCPVQESDP